MCSGVVIARGSVLTARHCVDRDDDGTWDAPGFTTVKIGTPTDPEVPEVDVTSAALHPELDIAILGANLPTVAPLRLSRDIVDASWLGATVELAGYGVSEQSEAPLLLLTVEEVVEIEADHIVVRGWGRSGACAGDSGGPLLARGNDGGISVMGVLDGGDPSCVGDDYYTRADRILAWPPISMLIGMEPKAAPTCDGVAAHAA